MASAQSTVPSIKVEAPPVYGTVMFAWPKRDAVYDGAKFGQPEQKSTQVVLCVVPIMGSGVTIDTTIYARTKPVKDGTEFSVSASLPKSIGGPRDATDGLLAHIENSVLAWPDYEKATQAAEDRLFGRKPTVKAATTRPDMRPRLVKATSAAPASA